ncbi:MAG: hypothetical protein PVF45_05730, partial [Anaerolineae bacterium]
GESTFSVIDSSLIGTPRERESIHTVKVTITDQLMDYWGIAGAMESVVTDDMKKVAFQSAEDYVTEQLKTGSMLEKELPPRLFSTKNSFTSCPYKLSNITYPDKTVFTVDIDDRVGQSIEICFEDYANFIQSEMRMTFWQHDKTRKKRKWISRPEQHAKNLLRTFLNGRFGDSLYTFEEIGSGAGVIDVFIISPGEERAVVELKMCGYGYSQTWARGGIQQLTHYMENKNSEIGYLMVFDSRVRDFAKGLQSTEFVNEMRVVTIIIDLRPYVKPEDAPSDA